MDQRVIATGDGHRVSGGGEDVGLVNQFLSHLGSRAFSPATVRAYAYDLLNFLRFLTGRCGRSPMWCRPTCSIIWTGGNASRGRGRRVVRLAEGRGAAPATMNRRIAAVRGLFEFAVTSGCGPDNPVPAARRSSGLRVKQRGLLGHVGTSRPRGGRFVRQARRKKKKKKKKLLPSA